MKPKSRTEVSDVHVSSANNLLSAVADTGDGPDRTLRLLEPAQNWGSADWLAQLGRHKHH